MRAGIPYTVATGEKLVNETFGPNNIRRRTSGTEQLFPMEVTDGRTAGRTTLDENGFVFVEHETAVKDFFDSEELKRVYYPEVAALKVGEAVVEAGSGDLIAMAGFGSGFTWGSALIRW